jgi:hypothetical protein
VEEETRLERLERKIKSLEKRDRGNPEDYCDAEPQNCCSRAPASKMIENKIDEHYRKAEELKQLLGALPRELPAAAEQARVPGGRWDGRSALGSRQGGAAQLGGSAVLVFWGRCLVGSGVVRSAQPAWCFPEHRAGLFVDGASAP